VAHCYFRTRSVVRGRAPGDDDELDPAASARMNKAARMILAYLDDADAGEHFAEGPGTNAAWDAVAGEVGPCLKCWVCIAIK
jgi:hypothetical protein